MGEVPPERFESGDRLTFAVFQVAHEVSNKPGVADFREGDPFGLDQRSHRRRSISPLGISPSNVDEETGLVAQPHEFDVSTPAAKRSPSAALPSSTSTATWCSFTLVGPNSVPWSSRPSPTRLARPEDRLQVPPSLVRFASPRFQNSQQQRTGARQSHQAGIGLRAEPLRHLHGLAQDVKG